MACQPTRGNGGTQNANHLTAPLWASIVRRRVLLLVYYAPWVGSLRMVRSAKVYHLYNSALLSTHPYSLNRVASMILHLLES
jgi:hypothetical protein